MECQYLLAIVINENSLKIKINKTWKYMTDILQAWDRYL